MRFFHRCPPSCECNGLAIDCSGRLLLDNATSWIPPTTRWLDISLNPNATTLVQLNETNVHNMVHLNVSHTMLKHLSDIPLEFMTNLIVFDISYNHLTTIGSNAFLSQSRLKNLIFKENHEIIIFETNAFSGLESLTDLSLSFLHVSSISEASFSGLQLENLHLSNNMIYDVSPSAFQSLKVDKLFLNKTEIMSFSRNMFLGIESVKLMVSDAYKFCCIRPEFLVEDDCYPRKDEFSSCADLMRSEFLRSLIWIIGMFALVGNVCSLGYRFKYERRHMKLGYGIFVTNLAVSDFLMGFYLIIIASADQYYRGNYIFYSDDWKGSNLCQFAGVIAFISSETSVMIMCLITLDRILVTKFPFGQFRITPKKAGFLISVVWLLSLTIALLPLNVFSYFKGEFYSKSGVCLALPLTRDRPPGWGYSIAFFIVFNSVMFILIALGQYIIFREINASKKKVGSSRSKRSNDLKVARNLLLVASTDFLCWFPIGVIGMSVCDIRTNN